MRYKFILLFITAIILVFSGCKKDADVQQSTVPVLNEKFELISEADMSAAYSLPMFKNISDEEFQVKLNENTLSFSERSNVNDRKADALKLLSVSDIESYSYSELGTYKVHCNDGKYISFSLSFEQRFTDDDKFEFVKQNFVFNYDVETGKEFEIASMFKNEDEVSEYIAKKLHERLLGMGCLENETYSNAVFKNNVLDYCAIMPSNRVAVVTTSGAFDLKLSAGAPIVEISIPEEYYAKSN